MHDTLVTHNSKYHYTGHIMLCRGYQFFVCFHQVTSTFSFFTAKHSVFSNHANLNLFFTDLSISFTIDSSFLSIIFILTTSYGNFFFKVVELDKLQLIPFVFYVRSYRKPYFRKPVQLVMTGLKHVHYYDSCVFSINTEPVHCLRL